jgi:membrane protease YdiL (CAAX protease family)
VEGGTWLLAAGAGFMAGRVVFILAFLSAQGMRLSDDGKLILLQVTLGPVLEKILFRGYLFALLLWGFAKARKTRWNVLVIPLGAMVFAVVHLSQPVASWLQVACITSTGAVYGTIRYASGCCSVSGGNSCGLQPDAVCRLLRFEGARGRSLLDNAVYFL